MNEEIASRRLATTCNNIMNPLLLEHFDQLISTPEDVERLNRSILQMAVQGQLVEQNPNDEPAKELLKRIQEEKEKLGMTQSLIKVEEEEKTFDLPKGWEWARWDDVSLQIADVDHKMPDEVDEGIPYVSPRDFKGEEEIAFSTAKKVSRRDYEDLATKIRPERGDIIFPRYGTIGVNRFVSVDFEFLASYSCAIIKHMKGLMNPRYVYFYSISPFLKLETQKYINKTTQANVGIKSIQKFVFPLPPLAEQERIVARVEELFAQTRLLAEQLAHSCTELDRLNESALAHLLASETSEEFNERWGFIAEHFDLLTSAPEHIAPLRQSILELAVRGKLAERDNNDLSNGNHYETVLAERAIQAEASGIAPNGKFTTREEAKFAFSYPKEWLSISLHESCTLITDGKHGDCADEPNSGYFFLSAKDISGGKLLYNNAREIVEKDFQEVHSRTRFEPGDVVVTCSGTIGKTAVALEDSRTRKTTFQKSVAILKPVRSVLNPHFLKIILVANLRLLTKTAQGSATQNLLLRDLKAFGIGLPSLAEQERIVKRVEQLLGWCDALEAQLRSAEEERGRLVESVLAMASML